MTKYPFIKLELVVCRKEGCNNTLLDDDGFCKEHYEEFAEIKEDDKEGGGV